MLAQQITQEEVEALYADCAAALDDGEFERGPSFFAENCSYSLASKEYVDRGWPIPLMACDTRGMILDRVMAGAQNGRNIPGIQPRVRGGVPIAGVEGG